MSSGELDSESNPWGWIIFRTCYTPESEDLWPTAIRLVDAWLDHKTRLSLRKCGEEDEHEEVMAQLDNVLIQGPSLEDASFDQLRSRFVAWLAIRISHYNGSRTSFPSTAACCRAPKTHQVLTIGRLKQVREWRRTSKSLRLST
jgi:hypothetical protein